MYESEKDAAEEIDHFENSRDSTSTSMEDNLPEDILKVLENLRDSDNVIVLDESNIISDLSHTSTNADIDTGSQLVEIVTTEATLGNNQTPPEQKTKKKAPLKKRIRNKNPAPRVWKPPPSKASNAQVIPISTLFQTEQIKLPDTENPENSQSDALSGFDELPDIKSAIDKRRSLRGANKVAESNSSSLVKSSETIQETSVNSTLSSTSTESVITATSAASKVASAGTSTVISSTIPVVSTSPETSSAPTVTNTQASDDSTSISYQASLDKVGSSVVPTTVATSGLNFEASAKPSTSTIPTSVPSSSSSVSSTKSSPPVTPKTANATLMAKYKKVLTPEIMKNILNFQSPINSSGPCIYKLPDGTQLKVNFGTLKKMKKRPDPKIKADTTSTSLPISTSVSKASNPNSDSAKTPESETKIVSEEAPTTKPPEKFNEAYLRVFTNEEVAANNNPDRLFNKYEIARAKKRIRQKLHPLPKGIVCPKEPYRGEMVAIYRNKEEFLNLIVKCSECNCYHCPLCSQDGKTNVYRPAKFLNKMLIRHLMIKHWDTRVSLIHNETEYQTLCCRLNHSGTIKKHLHCPCGRVFIRSDLHNRFRVHRKTVCPLTKHFHPVKPKVVIKKCPPCCTINPVPEDQHRSIFDSYEEFMREASAKCSSCDKYHCLVCSVTLYNPQKEWVLKRHLKRHYQNRVTLPGREAPFFIGCRQIHSDIRKKHFHCLCGQIVKSVAKTFLIHMKKCPFVLNPTGNRDNYTQMTMIKPTNLAMSFIKPIQVRAMIPRNSMPIYSRIGEKIPPPVLAMSIFDSLEELCSVIKRCYTCCTQYHCPLCPESVYQPSSRRMLAKHLLKIHYKQKIKLPSGQHSFPCYLPHHDRKKPVEPKHHHCVCGYVQVKKKRFLSHTRSCKQCQNRILNPAVERLHDFLVPETQLHNVHNNFSNLQQYPQTGNCNQSEVFEVSSSEEEEAPKSKEVPEPEPAAEEDANKSLARDHNMYCQTLDHWEETLEEHLKAKSMMTSMEIPEDDFEDAGDVQFGPFEEDDDDADILAKKKDRAFYHDIINNYQSDPMMGIFNPFDMLMSQLTQCTDCCDLYHCPWCPPETFVPNNYRNTSKHMKTHWSHRVLMIDGTFSLPCCHDHGLVLSKHYHCMCSEVVQAAPHIFYRHVKSCPYMLNLVEECRLGNQEVNAPMPAREVLYQTENKTKLDKVVDLLEIHIKSPQSSTSTTKSSTSQKQNPKRSKCKRKYERKKKAEDNSGDESVVAAQSIINESSDLAIAEDAPSIRKQRRYNTEEGGKGDQMNVYQFEEHTQIKNNGEAFVQTVESNVPSQNIIINAVGDEMFQQGCTYDIVIPSDGLIDINTIQQLLPSGSSYVIVDK